MADIAKATNVKAIDCSPHEDSVSGETGEGWDCTLYGRTTHSLHAVKSLDFDDVEADEIRANEDHGIHIEPGRLNRAKCLYENRKYSPDTLECKS